MHLKRHGSRSLPRLERSVQPSCRLSGAEQVRTLKNFDRLQNLIYRHTIRSDHSLVHTDLIALHPAGLRASLRLNLVSTLTQSPQSLASIDSYVIISNLDQI